MVKRFPSCRFFFFQPARRPHHRQGLIRRFSYLRLAFSWFLPSSFLEAINLMLRKSRAYNNPCGFGYSFAIVHVCSVILFSSLACKHQSSLQSLKKKIYLLVVLESMVKNKITKQGHPISKSSSRLCFYYDSNRTTYPGPKGVSTFFFIDILSISPSHISHTQGSSSTVLYYYHFKTFSRSFWLLTFNSRDLLFYPVM